MNRILYAFDKSIMYEAYPKDLDNDYELLASAINEICSKRDVVISNYQLKTIIQSLCINHSVVLFINNVWIKICTEEYLTNYGSSVSWI